MCHTITKSRLFFLAFMVFSVSCVLDILLIYKSIDIVSVDKWVEGDIDTVSLLRIPQSAYKNNSSIPTNNTSLKKAVQLIIVTRWRSGSTFVGELFNNNHEFAYFFEPLIGTVEGKTKIPFGHDHISVLHNILWCNFTNTNSTWWVDQKPINCDKSQTFSKTLLCEYFRVVLKPQNDTSAMIQEACRSQTHVAIKTVRVPDIGYLKKVVSDSRLNVKLIHLIRDPRAVFLSRQSTIGVDDMHNNECDEMESNLRYWKDPPDWLRGRHLLLRYEDVANDPLALTQTIYQFLGLQVPETVKMWIKLNTNGNEVGQNARARVSKEVAKAWRTKINFKTMMDVQRKCIVPLIMAGYKPITSNQDLNNLDVPALFPFPYPLQRNITHNVDAINNYI